MPVVETVKYETYTDDEKILVRDYLLKNHPAFFTYLMVTYHTGIRPKEVLALKIGDVDFKRKLILIKPDMQLENSKTKNIRIVPVNDHLAALLESHITGYNEKEMFLFGSPFEAGVGNRGRMNGCYGSARPDYFKPSFTQVKRDTATKLWKTIVKDKLIMRIKS